MKRTELRRKTPMPRGEFSLRRSAPIQAGERSFTRRAPLRAVSTKRAAVNRVRAKVVKQLFANNPLCVWPGCTAFATDPHEPLTRARGGSITDPGNVVGFCRSHHDHAHTEGQAEAEEIGLLVHSWNRKGLPRHG